MNTRDMSMQKDPAHVTREQLINDFKVVVADTEALMKATAGQGGEALAALRARVNESLAAAKEKMIETEESLLAKSKVAAAATDQYVHMHPWQAIGVATGVGLLIGMLIGRR